MIETVHTSFESCSFQQNVPVGLNLLFSSEKVNYLITCLYYTVSYSR